MAPTWPLAPAALLPPSASRNALTARVWRRMSEVALGLDFPFSPPFLRSSLPQPPGARQWTYAASCFGALPCPVPPWGPWPFGNAQSWWDKPHFSATAHWCFVSSRVLSKSWKTELIWSLQMPQPLMYSLELIQGYFYLHIPVSHLCFFQVPQMDLGSAMGCTNCHLLICRGGPLWAAWWMLPYVLQSSREGEKPFLSWW